MSKKEVSCSSKKTSIGGQALIEGIMMRGPKVSAMAVRNPEGEIVLEKWENNAPKKDSKKSSTWVRFTGDGVVVEKHSNTIVVTFKKVRKIPFVRGIFNFVDSMTQGYKCLMRSAEISGLEELEAEAEREKAEKKAAKKAKRAEKKGLPLQEEQTVTADEAANPEENKKEKKSGFGVLMSLIMGAAMVLGVLLSVGLFIILPSYIYKGAVWLIPSLEPENAAMASLVKSFFESFLRIVVLVGYMALVSLMKDIRRTFMYHGAEHKTIFCYESGLDLTVENVKSQRRFHPRCGTSFLILMLLVGMFISFLIDPISIAATGAVPPTWLRSIIKILLLPLTMGVGYELIRLAGKHDNLFTRIISAPGMWLQRLTVFEPTDDMIECAITAFVEVIPENESDATQK